MLADLAKLTPAELDALKRRHRAALAVLADIEQEQRPLLLAAVVWPSEAVERAAWGVDHDLVYWIVVDVLSEFPARQSGATPADAVGSSAHVWLSHSTHLEAGSRNRRNRRRKWQAPAAP